MQLLASGDDTAKIVIVAIGVVAFGAIVAWKVYAVARAVKDVTKTAKNPEEKQKAIGSALHGNSYGKGYDAGKQTAEKLASLFKRKGP